MYTKKKRFNNVKQQQKKEIYKEERKESNTHYNFITLESNLRKACLFSLLLLLIRFSCPTLVFHLKSLIDDIQRYSEGTTVSHELAFECVSRNKFIQWILQRTL